MSTTTIVRSTVFTLAFLAIGAMIAAPTYACTNGGASKPGNDHKESSKKHDSEKDCDKKTEVKHEAPKQTKKDCDKKPEAKHEAPKPKKDCDKKPEVKTPVAKPVTVVKDTPKDAPKASTVATPAVQAVAPVAEATKPVEAVELPHTGTDFTGLAIAAAVSIGTYAVMMLRRR